MRLSCRFPDCHRYFPPYVTTCGMSSLGICLEGVVWPSTPAHNGCHPRQHKHGLKTNHPHDQQAVSRNLLFVSCKALYSLQLPPVDCIRRSLTLNMQLFLTTLALFASAFAAPTSVDTSSGTLIGHESSNKTHVTEFLGIRYAQAPVGELRFAAPRKYVALAGMVFELSSDSLLTPGIGLSSL
jgi:hypothetical protein